MKEENRSKIGTLINPSGVVPNKKALLSIASEALLDITTKEIRELYELMVTLLFQENDFNLINFGKKAESILDFLKTTDYAKFIPMI